ncbi:SH3 domain-containing protein [Bartonella sp. CB178]|uniref:SH3 domain-containing protein n=1 Tax=Bartonella sp. CB178 TaxID=3112255 RepID=UPI00300E4C09
MLSRNLLSATTVMLAFAGSVFGMPVFRADAGTVARIAAGHAILRTGPATAHEIIAVIPTGEKVRIRGCLSNRSWCLFQYNRMVGWASARYLNTDSLPTISFAHMKPSSTIKAKKDGNVVSRFKVVMVPKKTKKRAQRRHVKTSSLLSSASAKKDERTILNPSTDARDASVKHVNAYNPLFPTDVNYRNFERNETRYRVITYPVLY